MRYMLDTDICIYLIKKKPVSVIERLRGLAVSEVGISSITLAELLYGVSKSAQPQKNRDALEGLLVPLEIASFDDRAAQCYGVIRADLERRGALIGAMDMLIAAHAMSLSTILVTNNTRELERVVNLRLENWA